IVDVTVKDKNGKSIENLKAEDFSVLEDGKLQKLALFEPQKLSVDPRPPDPPPSLDDQLELPDDPKTTITKQTPGKVQYHNKRLMALFSDFSWMAMPEQLRAQEAATKFIDDQMTPSDMVAILLNTATVQIKTDFTDNRTVLRDIIKDLPIGEMSELA